jgi:hypothetical protein
MIEERKPTHSCQQWQAQSFFIVAALIAFLVAFFKTT